MAMVRDDMALLRQMPGVIDATPISQVPLSGSGSSSGYYALPDKKGKDSPANIFRVDEHGANTLGVKLSAGKTCDSTMVERKQNEDQGSRRYAIVSQGFAEALFPGEKNAGRQGLLRRPEQAHPHHRRHRAHARFMGGMGQGRSRDAGAAHHRIHAATSCAPGPANSTG